MKKETFGLLLTLKSSAIKYILLSLSLLAPIKIFIILVGLFILLDTCFGIWAAKRLNKKRNSKKFSQIFSKILVYNSVVITAYVLDIHLLGEFFLLFLSIPLAITKITVLALISNEIYSMDEKVVNVTGKGLWDMFKRLLGMAKFIKKQKDEIL